MNENEIGSLILDTAIDIHEIDKYKTWLHSKFRREINEGWDSTNY